MPRSTALALKKRKASVGGAATSRACELHVPGGSAHWCRRRAPATPAPMRVSAWSWPRLVSRAGARAASDLEWPLPLPGGAPPAGLEDRPRCYQFCYKDLYSISNNIPSR